MTDVPGWDEGDRMPNVVLTNIDAPDLDKMVEAKIFSFLKKLRADDTDAGAAHRKDEQSRRSAGANGPRRPELASRRLPNRD